ncbi:hypothetical protein ALR00_101902 [Pseudomonas savastanoi pv. retacarpa]|nr:hypothetical protein ALR00_101902 [Pseudomonas savastanoi pv. retacarpa]
MLLNLGPFDDMHESATCDCVVLQAMIKQAGQHRQFAPDRAQARPRCYNCVPG